MILTLICILSISTFANAAENKVSLISKESQEEQALSNEDIGITPMSADYGVVNGNGVRVRKNPGKSGAVLGLLYKGDEVEISDGMGRIRKDGQWWIYVMPMNSNRASGWVAERYITIYN